MQEPVSYRLRSVRSGDGAGGNGPTETTEGGPADGPEPSTPSQRPNVHAQTHRRRGGDAHPFGIPVAVILISVMHRQLATGPPPTDYEATHPERLPHSQQARNCASQRCVALPRRRQDQTTVELAGGKVHRAVVARTLPVATVRSGAGMAPEQAEQFAWVRDRMAPAASQAGYARSIRIARSLGSCHPPADCRVFLG
jgi:hypothetical protein